LEKVVEKRMRNKSLGFQAEIKSSRQRHNEAFEKLEPEDLIAHYGLIPEFVGRLPVLGVCTNSTKKRSGQYFDRAEKRARQAVSAQIRVRQRASEIYGRRFKAVAQQAVERKVGARGLMMIMEEILLDPMYVLPSQKRVKEFVITKEMVERKAATFDLGLAKSKTRRLKFKNSILEMEGKRKIIFPFFCAIFRTKLAAKKSAFA
jgi:ATP-dependent Clp protease ATP-binding subunit ClpX